MNVTSDVPGIRAREDLAFPTSLLEFQRLFPDNAACAGYLERVRWENGFECPYCHKTGEPYRFATRPGVLTCRKCRRQTSLTVGTVMQRTHTPLSTWFWGAYLVSSMTPGISAVQFKRQLGLTHIETAFQILHKLRTGMAHANRDRIGGTKPNDHVEVQTSLIGGTTNGRDQSLVVAAVEVLSAEAKVSGAVPRRGRRYAGRLLLEVIPHHSARALCGFVEAAIEPGTMVVTDACPGYATLDARGYQHLVVAENNQSDVPEGYLSMVRLVILNLNSWLKGTHHGVSPQHLQTYLNEFSFRFNHRFEPFSAFRSLLGLACKVRAPTYAELYSGEWKHATLTSTLGAD
jgi:transposase-like protein